MTKVQTMKRVEKMMQDDRKWLIEKCKKLLSSGAVDLDNYEDDFRLPKIILCAALKELHFQRMPLSTEDREATINLQHF